jgi:acyl carrier protein
VDDPTAQTLMGCFEKVFPDLPRSAIPSAAHTNLPGWDSLAQVTLLSLVGEEFALDIDFEEMEGATSFAALLELVRAKLAGR